MGNLIESVHDMNDLFQIRFTDEPVLDLEPGEIAATGMITLCTYTERFVADLSYWNRDRYHLHWLAALRSILEPDGRSALITSMHNPATAKFIQWWPMWREGPHVIFHNQLLFLNQLHRPFDASNPSQFVGARQSINDDGAPISEWSVPVSSIQHFLNAHPQ